MPTGCTQSAEGEFRFDLHGVRARLVCAAVARAEVVSGWDMARWQPKPSHRAAPTGSVFWLDVPQGAGPQLWGRSMCTGQWLRDGWGVCVVGTA